MAARIAAMAVKIPVKSHTPRVMSAIAVTIIKPRVEDKRPANHAGNICTHRSLLLNISKPVSTKVTPRPIFKKSMLSIRKLYSIKMAGVYL